MVNGHLLVPSTIQSLLANGTGNSVLSSSTSGKVSKRQPGTQWRLMMYGSCPQSMIHMFERVLLNVYDPVSFHSKSVFIVVLHYLLKKHTRHIVKVFEQKGHSKVNKWSFTQNDHTNCRLRGHWFTGPGPCPSKTSPKVKEAIPQFIAAAPPSQSCPRWTILTILSIIHWLFDFPGSFSHGANASTTFVASANWSNCTTSFFHFAWRVSTDFLNPNKRIRLMNQTVAPLKRVELKTLRTKKLF